jgi:phosphopantothenoylcysteine decarboxylase/phosphopantothenate--cysteine ligase
MEVVDVISAEDMFQAVTSRAAKQDIIIKTAAVADYRPAVVATEKVKKKDGDMSIALERTKDILAYLGANKKEDQFLCGFSMETENMLENSITKLVKKNLDMVIANNLKVEGAGFGTNTNVVTIITRKGGEALPLMSKDEVADKILDAIIKERNKK